MTSETRIHNILLPKFRLEETFLSLEIQVTEKNVFSKVYFPEAQKHPQKTLFYMQSLIKSPQNLFISYFVNKLSQIDLTVFTESQRINLQNVSRGLGKAVLCETVRYLRNEGLIQSNAQVSLQALSMGSRCDPNVVSGTWTLEQCKAFLRGQPFAYKYLNDIETIGLDDTKKLEVQRTEVCEIVQNEKLQKQQTQMQGFQIDHAKTEKGERGAMMHVSIRRILTFCDT